MAIFHSTLKTIKRSEGRNAIASAAYRRAACLSDYREGTQYNYTNKQHVIYSEIMVPENAPPWAKALATAEREKGHLFSEKLWNKVEAIEKRSDAQLARELEFALPLELTEAQNIALAREYIQDQLVARGMIADWSVHWDEGNPHVHVMLTLRELSSQGFGQKVRAWNEKALAVEWRQKLAEYTNFYLKRHGHAITVDHRSYKAQGIDLIPSKHQGKAVTDMERRGIKTEIAREANKIRQENLRCIAANPAILFHKMVKERETFTPTDIGHEMGKYANDRDKFSYKSILASLLPGALVLQTEETLTAQKILTAEVMAQVIQSIEQHASVFKEKDLAKALLPFTAHAEDLAKALFEIKASDHLIALGTGEDGRERFTTPHLFKIENKIQHIAQQLEKARHLLILKLNTEHLLKAYERETGKRLTDEQQEAVKHLIGKKALRCLIGRAGTGKSFTLGVARYVWEAFGLQVRGIALSGVAASNLSHYTGMTASTIESFRQKLKKGSLVLNSKDVIVMDEAGMTDSFAMLEVLEAVEKAKAKLVLVGDPQQLQPVGPGASFRAIIENTGFAELQDVYRQKIPWQREATRLLAKGHTDQAIELYSRHHCVHLKKDSIAAMVHLLKDWQAKAKISLANCLALTHRNEEVKQINTFMRMLLVQEKRLAEGFEVQTQAIKIAKDDRLLLTKNDRALELHNGDFCTVTEVKFTESGKVIHFKIKLDTTGKEVVIDPWTYPYFDYGYCATVHKAQGLTVDHVFVYANSYGWDRHLSYVALSRHRESCQLYATKETYTGMEALKKSLHRLALKDSVMDFPVQFSKRRCINVSDAQKIALRAKLMQHLKSFTRHIKDSMEQAFNPSRYWERKNREAIEQQSLEETFTRRQDAKQVAAYVEANRQCGIAWEHYQKKVASLGIDVCTLEMQTLFSKLPEAKALRKALAERNKRASDLYAQTGRYSRALDIYQIKSSTLARQSNSHHFWEKFRSYLQLKKTGRSVLRDKLAFELCTQLKTHYTFVKTTRLDFKLLRQHAFSHERKQLLKSLTIKSREDFKKVEAYQEAHKKAGKLLQALKKMHASALTQDLRQVIQQRNALAAEIYKNAPRFETALTFYAYGEARPAPGFDKITEASRRYAHARWYKLMNHAAQHTISQKIAHYCQAQTLTKQTLAWEILQDPEGYKAYYPVLLQAGIPVNDFWKKVSQDAKAYERRQFFEELSVTEREDFILVENYAKERQAIKQAWKILFTQPEGFNSLSKPDETRCQALGSQIFNALERYKKYLPFFHLSSDSLAKDADKHDYRKDVLHYQQADNRLEKGRLAKIILDEPKAHYGAMLECNITWKLLYKDREVVERQALFKQLAPDEKALLRLLHRYQKTRAKAGKAVKKLMKNKSLNKALPPALQITTDKLAAKRDALAYQLQDKYESFKLQNLFDKNLFTLSLDYIEKNKSLHWEKIQTHAERHKTKLATIESWKQAKSQLDAWLQKLWIAPADKSQGYANLLFMQEEMRETYKPLYQKPLAYCEALHAYGESLESFYQWLAIYHHIEKVTKAQRKEERPLHKAIALDNEQRQRIGKARKIAKEALPIHGTLAERYLREHRGIMGTLPKSLRYHPAYYNHLAGKKAPALVVIAKNRQKEIQAVQVISLDPKTAHKAFGKQSKITFGVLSGAGVLINSGSFRHPVIVAEGPETALSVAQAMPHHTVYAALGSSNFGYLPLSEKVSQVIFAADNDGKEAASLKYLENVAEKLSLQGKEVYFAMPDEVKTDFNDLLKTQGTKALQEKLANPLPYLPGAVKKDVYDEAIDQMLKEGASKFKKAMPLDPYEATIEEILREGKEKSMDVLPAKKDIYDEAIDKILKEGASKPKEAMPLDPYEATIEEMLREGREKSMGILPAKKDIYDEAIDKMLKEKASKPKKTMLVDPYEATIEEMLREGKKNLPAKKDIYDEAIDQMLQNNEAMQTLPKFMAERSSWRENFPEVIVHTTVKERNAHPDYLAAKTGNKKAAFRLVNDLISSTALERIQQLIGDQRPVVVPVTALEQGGINEIPDAMAHIIAGKLGLPMEKSLIQANVVNLGGTGTYYRIAFPAVFEGEVKTGQCYLLVDDHVGLGGTLANLKGLIEKKGGSVILMTTLSASHNSQYLVPTLAQMESLKQKHGEALDLFLREELDHGIETLTRAEAGQLLSAPDVNAIRESLFAAKSGRSHEALSQHAEKKSPQAIKALSSFTLKLIENYLGYLEISQEENQQKVQWLMTDEKRSSYHADLASKADKEAQRLLENIAAQPDTKFIYKNLCAERRFSFNDDLSLLHQKIKLGHYQQEDLKRLVSYFGAKAQNQKEARALSHSKGRSY